MKRSVLKIAAMGLLGAVALLAGCTSTGGLQPISLTPAQAVAIICPPLQTAITQGKSVLATLPAGDARVTQIEAAMTKANPVITAACTQGATVSIANIQDFSTTVLPALSAVASALPLTSVQQQQAQAVIMSAEVTVGLALAIKANAGVIATSPSTSPATSAPAAPAAASGAAVTSSSGVTPALSSSGDVASALVAKPYTL